MPFFLTADDFGASASINQAIIQAHQAGMIQGTSLMMGEPDTASAVALAKENRSLRVGLHVTLVDGTSVLPREEIPDLVDQNRRFERNAGLAWMKMLFQPKCIPQIYKEVSAQFRAFSKTGLPLSHVDGHHHFHLHPYVFRMVALLAREFGAAWVRVPREDMRVWHHVSPKPRISKYLLGYIHYGLTRGKRKFLQDLNFFTYDGVFGNLETFSMTEEFVSNLFHLNPPGNHELYFHPGASWNRDLEILLNPEVREQAKLVTMSALPDSANGRGE